MDGELVVINLRTGLYYSSMGIGAVIWQLMEAGQTAEGISARIAGAFKVEADGVRSDVTTFLQRLIDEQLVEPGDADVTAAADAAITYAGAYESPALVTFTDMEQAFALDPPLRA